MTARILNEPFSKTSRSDLLEAHKEALERALSLPDETLAYEEANAKLWKIRRDYGDQLPLVRFCLSPFDGAPFDHSIDIYGLDGLWWSALEFLRPLEFLPRHVAAFTGSMTLSEPLEHTSFLVKPGPGAPFVVPWLLELPGVKAVLCPMKIGGHRGWPVIYFRQPGTPQEGGFNTWGSNRSQFMVDEETSGWHEWSAGPEDYDFDLEPWMKSGRLLWVPEEDESGIPREGMTGFDWLDQKGPKLLQLVCQGRVMLQEPFAPVEWEEEEESEPQRQIEGEQWWHAPVPEPEWPLDQPEIDPTGEVELDENKPAASPEPKKVEAAHSNPPVQPSAPPVQSGPKFCRQCGKPLKAGARFCGECGARLQS